MRDKCKFYNESLLERFIAFKGKLGAYCDTCDMVECQFNAKHWGIESSRYAMLVIDKLQEGEFNES